MTNKLTLLFGGDVNLMGVDDGCDPFIDIAPSVKAADACFANLECCLFDDPKGADADGYFASTRWGSLALQGSGIAAVGVANNVNHGREPILSSLRTLRALGIPSTGAGANVGEARAPLILERQGLRIGVLQRTAVYWPDDQEATPDRPGVAVIAAHTAYRNPSLTQRRPGLPPANRPGMPPVIETWAEPHSRELLVAELKALRKEVDVMIASFHWGLFEEVLGYMRDYAHAAIDCGADLVVGHGPHDHLLPIESYQGRTIFYNLGALSFQHGPNRKRFHEWIGLLARFDLDGGEQSSSFRFVRQDEDMNIRLCTPQAEGEALAYLQKQCAAVNTSLEVRGDEIKVSAVSVK